MKKCTFAICALMMSFSTFAHNVLEKNVLQNSSEAVVVQVTSCRPSANGASLRAVYFLIDLAAMPTPLSYPACQEAINAYKEANQINSSDINFKVVKFDHQEVVTAHTDPMGRTCGKNYLAYLRSYCAVELVGPNVAK